MAVSARNLAAFSFGTIRPPSVISATSPSPDMADLPYRSTTSYFHWFSSYGRPFSRLARVPFCLSPRSFSPCRVRLLEENSVSTSTSWQTGLSLSVWKIFASGYRLEKTTMTFSPLYLVSCLPLLLRMFFTNPLHLQKVCGRAESGKMCRASLIHYLSDAHLYQRDPFSPAQWFLPGLSQGRMAGWRLPPSSKFHHLVGARRLYVTPLLGPTRSKPRKNMPTTTSFLQVPSSCRSPSTIPSPFPWCLLKGHP